MLGAFNYQGGKSMERPINHDQLFLQQKATPATQTDLTIGLDLQDTLQAHQKECVGMAANMIGVNKAIIIVSIGPLSLLMFNPKIVHQSQPYETKEGCLSLSGERPTTRYQQITVTYMNKQWQKQQQDFSGFTAEIIQHEIDHLHGILI